MAARRTASARRNGLAQFAGRNWTANRKARAEAALAKAAAQPIDPEWLMLTIAELLPKDAIVVDEALTTAASLAAFLPMRDRYAYFGNVSGGIGWGIAAAVGVQLAQPDRKVVALLGDGSAMYSIQALWTAAHQKLPITFVVFNNGGYRIIKQRLKLFHGTDRFIGMDFVDPPDRVRRARAQRLACRAIVSKRRMRSGLRMQKRLRRANRSSSKSWSTAACSCGRFFKASASMHRSHRARVLDVSMESCGYNLIRLPRLLARGAVHP